MLVLMAVLALIIQEASGSSIQQTGRMRVDEITSRISTAELENQHLQERLRYAQSAAALREIAKRELGLIDPGDHAVVIIDAVAARPKPALQPIPIESPPDPDPIEFGHFGSWMALLLGNN